MQNYRKYMGMFKYNVKAWCALVARKRNVKPRFWLILMAVLMVVGLGIIFSSDNFIRGQQLDIAQKELQKEEETKKNAVIERKIAFSKSDEYIERVAHEDLGLVKPDEIRFVAGVDQQTQAPAQTDGQ